MSSAVPSQSPPDSASTPPSSAEQRFVEVLSNSFDRRRTTGFVVLVRGTTGLATLQGLCHDPGYMYRLECLTARYRLTEPSLGSLFAAFVSDIRRRSWSSEGGADRRLGDIRPGHLENPEPWQRLRALVTKLAEVVDKTTDGRLSPSWQQAFFSAVDEAVGKGQRLVLFAELERQPTYDVEWDDDLPALARRLPQRLGLVLVGEPGYVDYHDNLSSWLTPARLMLLRASQPRRSVGYRVNYSNNPSLLQIRLEPGGQPLLHADFVDAPFTGDQLADADTLDRRWYAEALASLVMLPDTGPMTIGVHGRWGVGKSSFMRFIRWELLRAALADRSVHLGQLERADRAVARAAEALADAGADVLRTSLLRGQHAQALRERGEVLHRLERAAADTVLCVRFNAWLYEGATQVWAGLTHEITRTMENSLPWHRRLAARARYAWLIHGPGFWVGAALGVVTAVLLAGLALVLGYGDAGSALAAQLPPVLDVVARALPVGSVLAVGLLLVWRLSRGFVPVSGRIAQYLRRPDYRAQMGYQHQLRRDIEFLKARLRRGDRTPRIVVFIDDLDRCSDERVLETLQAINLLLTESGCYVILGIDTEMIVNAIRRRYESENDGPTAGTEQRARSYLDKILQLNVPLRAPDTDGQLAFLADFFSPQARRALAAAQRDGQPEPEPQDQEFEPIDAGELPFDRQLVHAPPEHDYEVRQVEDTPDELLAFAALREHLPDNPRELKRLVNAHRLVRLLARHGGRRPGPVQRRLIVGWLLFCFTRPAAAAQAVSAARASTDPTTELTHDELTPFLLPGDDGAGALKLTSADLAPGTPLGEAWEIIALVRRHAAVQAEHAPATSCLAPAASPDAISPTSQRI